MMLYDQQPTHVQSIDAQAPLRIIKAKMPSCRFEEICDDKVHDAYFIYKHMPEFSVIEQYEAETLKRKIEKIKDDTRALRNEKLALERLQRRQLTFAEHERIKVRLKALRKELAPYDAKLRKLEPLREDTLNRLIELENTVNQQPIETYKLYAGGPNER